MLLFQSVLFCSVLLSCFFAGFAFKVLFSADFVFAGFIIDPTRVWLFLFVVSVCVCIPFWAGVVLRVLILTGCVFGW